MAAWAIVTHTPTASPRTSPMRAPEHARPQLTHRLRCDRLLILLLPTPASSSSAGSALLVVGRPRTKLAATAWGMSLVDSPSSDRSTTSSAAIFSWNEVREVRILGFGKDNLSC